MKDLTVLVVDDDVAYAQGLRAVLEAHGHCVWAVYEAQEAITLLKQNEYDRVLVDVMMPYMDGFELLKWIRSQDRGVQWVALMTAQVSEVTTPYEGLQFQFNPDCYLPKPIQPADLLKALNYSLDL